MHYAGEITRALGSGVIKETPELAEFIIENIINDEGFVEMAKEHRSSAMLALGGKAALRAYISDLVYSQLNIEDVNVQIA